MGLQVRGRLDDVEGPTIQPTRQPVIAKDFATPPSRIVVSASSGTAFSTEVKGMSP